MVDKRRAGTSADDPRIRIILIRGSGNYRCIPLSPPCRSSNVKPIVRENNNRGAIKRHQDQLFLILGFVDTANAAG